MTTPDSTEKIEKLNQDAQYHLNEIERMKNHGSYGGEIDFHTRCFLRIKEKINAIQNRK